MRKALCFVVLGALACGPVLAESRKAPIIGTLSVPSTETLVFKERGSEVSTLDLATIRKELSPKPVLVYEPHEKKQVSYVAVPAPDLFDKAYGKAWRNAEEVVFTCHDGYQPSIPVKYFLESKAYFAIERVGKQYFVLTNKEQNEALVALGPYYLIWDGLKDRAIKLKGTSIWPYQVVGVDLAKFEDRFPRMAPGAGAKAQVRSGFLQFRTHCMSCHTINGEGGAKARDLNYPRNITETRDDAWLTRFFENPGRLVPGIKMAPFNKLEPNRSGAIRDLIAYLKHMKARQSAPEK